MAKVYPSPHPPPLPQCKIEPRARYDVHGNLSVFLEKSDFRGVSVITGKVAGFKR